MDFSLQEQHPGKKAMGIAFAVLFHAALIWALVNGLGKAVIDILPTDGEVTILPPPAVKPVEPPPTVKEPVFKKIPTDYFPPIEVYREHSPDGPPTIIDTTPLPPEGPNDRGAAITQPIRVPAVVDARACEKPDYPSRAIREGLEGTTVLQFLIGVDGRVMDSKIARSSGYRDLDNAALTGLARCAFKAGTVDGKPEQSWARIQYAWKLDQ